MKNIFKVEAIILTINKIIMIKIFYNKLYNLINVYYLYYFKGFVF